MFATRRLSLGLSLIAAAFGWAPAGATVTVDWADVGGPGNVCRTHTGSLDPSEPPFQAGCFGAVAAPFKIARTEVTNAQYAAFLNAVAQSDPNGLYNTSMA